MYRVIVVDDEPFIVDWVSGLIEDIEEYELDVYRAYSSKEAVSILQKANVDLVVSDICMPGMSGLDLLKKAKKEWPQCRFIMLSGYSDFNYMYEAVNNKAATYILKNEDDDKILEAIHKELSELDKEYYEKSKHNSNIEGEYEVDNKLHHEFLRGVLAKAYTDKNKIVSKIKEYKLNIDIEKPFYMLIYYVKSNNHINNDYSYINKLCYSLLNEKFNCTFVDYGENEFVWILQKNDKKFKASVSANITAIIENLQSILKRKKITISAVFHSKEISFSRLSNTLLTMEAVIREEIKIGSGFVKEYLEQDIYDKNIKYSKSIREIGNSNINTTITDQIKIYLNGGNKEELFNTLDLICNEIKNTRSIYDTMAMETYVSIASIIMNYINHKNISESLSTKVDFYKILYFDHITSWKSRIDYLYDVINAIFDLKNEENSNIGINLIWFIEKYINDNVSSDISLIKLSEITGYNPSYISRVFKKSKGITISEYSANVRKHLIIDLISQKKYKINEIAVKSGFNSRQYFNRFIKKTFGMTPEELVKKML